VPTTKVQPGFQSSNGHTLDELDEQVVIARMGDAIAEAASQRREAIGEDPRQAARRAAVDIATATLSATSAATATHSDDVDVISEGIARRLGVSGQELEDVMMAARLHDIGKLGVPPSTIEKPGPLNRAEWEVIHRHTIIGEQILLAVPELRGAGRLVRYSHERWDGSGYPDGLAGEQIPLGSRIVFCADAFHAIRSDRPYRAGRSAVEALAEIRACAGTQFDPTVVEALMTLSDELRTVTNGARSRSRRAQRLLALMLIVSVGACSSALARSGLMPEPDPSHAAPQTAGAASLGASGTGGLGPGGKPTSSSGAAADGAGGSSGAINDLRSLTLLTPGLSLIPGADGDAPNPFGVGVPEGNPAATGSPQGDDRPGVRDHGQGVGRGKGQGKGRGAELGRGHQKTEIAKEHGNGSVPRANGAGKGKAKAHAGSSKGNANSSDSATAKLKASSHGKAKSNTGGSDQASTTKPPKPPKAPKPSNDTPPAPVQSPGTPPESGNGNPIANASGAGSESGHGNGHG
jgi:HD domain-containing protein